MLRTATSTNAQETNTGGKAKMPDHYRCTITCAFCGKRKHYEDECYHKQRLSAKLKSEAQNGGGGGGSKGNGEKGKGKSQGRGKGKGQEQGKGGGRGGPDKKNHDKNQDRSGGNPNPTPRGTNPEPSGGQQNPGPTTRSQTQAQQEQGAKRGNEDGDESNPRKRSRFMRMARKLRKKGFDVTRGGHTMEALPGEVLRLTSAGAIFAMLISPLAQKLASISEHMQVVMYADDPLIINPGSLDQAVFIFILASANIKFFSKFSRLLVNCRKLAIPVKGCWTEAHKVQLLSMGLLIQDSYKYLGVQFGSLTPEEAYSHALGKAMGRAFAMQTWALSLPERIYLLKLWILPLRIFPTRVVYPNAAVVSTFKTIYHIALKLNSWGVTLDILSHSLDKGGVQFGRPRNFSLMATHYGFC